MANRLRLGVSFKITALVVVVVFMSVTTISYIAFNVAKGYFQERYQESVEVITRLKTQKIEAFLEKIKANIKFGSELKAVRTQLEKASQGLPTPIKRDTTQTKPNEKKEDKKDEKKVEKKEEKKQVQPEPPKPNQEKTNQAQTNQEKPNQAQTNKRFGDEEMEDLVQNVLKSYEVRNIYLTSQEGIVLYNKGIDESTEKNGKVFQEADANTIRIGRDSVYFSQVFPRGNETLMHVAAPVKDRTLGNTLGMIIYEVRLNYVFRLLSDTTGLGETGEILLVKSTGNQVNILNTPRLFATGKYKKIVSVGAIDQTAVQNAVKPENAFGFGEDRDYRGKHVMAMWSYIPITDWGLVVKLDLDEANKPINSIISNLFITGVIVFLMSILIGIIFSRRTIIRPLFLLKNVAGLLAKGALPDRLPNSSQTNDEIGEMSESLANVVQGLKIKANFARNIGQGDLLADFQPTGDTDLLGNALLSMRDSIKNTAKRDEERNWIVTGLAEIGDILPSIATIDELGELVSEFVTKKIGAVQGAFYIVNGEGQNQIIELVASYAYGKRKYLKAQFRFAEGLIGQAAVEKNRILRTEIPDDYMSITSGILGDRKPKCILITPLITNETVYGVLEFAGFEKFQPREIEFVEEISEIIARTVFNIKVKENTERLLHESQQMGSELQDKQKILQQNAIAMEESKNELERVNVQLEEKIREVQLEQDRTQLFLANASEIITIYEADGTIRYISPSVQKIMGYTTQEMIGLKDIIYVHPEGVEAYENMFMALLEKPDEKVTIQYSYQHKDKDYIWLEATGANFLDDPALQGILINVRDITERREAEREQRLRGQMQALSENSPDLITRITREGQIFYVNPIIENYTGKTKDFYSQKFLGDAELPQVMLQTWQDVFRDAMNKGHKIHEEMSFMSERLGNRTMQVNAIPEFSENNSLESVLVVSHDITERKIIEEQITDKNRKITESINYAKRIQEAILPDTNYIKQVFRNSFILYKPRDVVSGDFPWFLQLEEDVYIAAVDCTGHGVPGALISLIGFFLLNNIVRLGRANTPGTILDSLDEEVTRTLKQDEQDAATRDGMDISLCKINLKKRQVEYAGAHRPLYYYTEDELLEIKGNKFPIGGGQYKNRSKFTNSVINYLDGDSIYLFSDGYPDQFGGPKNKKLSPRKIREVVSVHTEADMSEICRMLDREFEEWKGTNKQTDDVLMIGIKF
ncbi:MAG: PAS domain S-box protein [Bacteroidetes bacterium]|nr:MAG: PAS domain S-box protein [Bacteroidota bacterium]